jgi:hypothetical protein
MYIVELALKGNPLTLSVQRKEKEGADALYDEVLQKLVSGESKLIELNCEKELDKKVAVFSSEIAGILVSEKSGTMTNSGAGFVRK